MTAERVDPFKTLDNLDDFQTKGKPKDVPSKTAIDDLAKATGFPSRQGKESRGRHYTTGRNQQLNLKVTKDALDRFYNLADEMEGVPLGEIFNQAIKLLEASRRTEQ